MAVTCAEDKVCPRGTSGRSADLDAFSVSSGVFALLPSGNADLSAADRRR
ncbi:hypothetical protein SAMN05660657_04716 [Geodermatophilus amargosae]|uniref:Uncharacterized protein n=1 Tax=Geodermatophilus amargosae TaxID=1296565 RepID=A0A1I7CP15_9ACTN|nr:hypothetical protein SAMN05660657_04716 [Geodermatophilus amargosae]